MATVFSPPEQRVVLENIKWDIYERILEAHRDCSVPRFTYDGGRLEIMSPSAKHEELRDLIVQLVSALAEGMDVDMRSFGSTTFRREDFERGFEPDGCFYIQSVGRISRGEVELDLTIDPPPDLIIEIDITSPSIKKLPIFAQMGVPEVWRYDGKRWSILALEGSGEFVERSESRALPGVTAEVIERFIDESFRVRRPDWLRGVRDWARQLSSENKTT